MDERAQAIELPGELAKRRGSLGFPRQLERADEPNYRLAIIGVDLERDPEMADGAKGVAFCQGELAAKPRQGGVVTLCCVSEQPLGPFRIRAINRDLCANGNRLRIVARERLEHRLGGIVLAHSALVLREGEPGPAVEGIGRDISAERVDCFTRLP